MNGTQNQRLAHAARSLCNRLPLDELTNQDLAELVCVFVEINERVLARREAPGLQVVARPTRTHR